ncbi:hypothetical protein L6452_42592 [Arctium lappa]|uniref:Uncharacterized protein n=1 Tax=Arctium lappa TaxID=4217 RepID=A0ACB8XIW9_ARCLA|nr:hypothetical protein L6452_42592 [Arctium lappa]
MRIVKVHLIHKYPYTGRWKEARWSPETWLAGVDRSRREGSMDIDTFVDGRNLDITANKRCVLKEARVKQSIEGGVFTLRV